ncbi:hypothetical protein DCC81_03930 [Chitinophaga parva]|uniref:Uncharacterized protein n=1 Tax=Chitinophaga parva TaxID=2169414 RepID=A0A2T7BLU5_9BACT|nr:hypothetical protein [Chitinophaga parva]PUZ28642.1 hypothetical protein DCC81_03930 [Chitinophaga parva]
MVNEISKSRIKAWVNRELAGYMREFGSDYRTYIREDGVGEFAADGSEDLKEAVAGYITRVIMGTEDN